MKINIKEFLISLVNELQEGGHQSDFVTKMATERKSNRITILCYTSEIKTRCSLNA